MHGTLRPLHRVAGILIGIPLLALPACQTHTGTALDRRVTQGAVAGAVVGGTAGALTDARARWRGALIGGALGGIAGGLIGAYLDQQAEELATIPNAALTRSRGTLVAGFPADLLFEADSAVLAPGACARLGRVADTLVRYPESDVFVRGHTDARGSAQHNLRLSESRAGAVRDYLIAERVHPSRITALGFGEAMPVASNATAAGRQQNRRVEVEIRPRAGFRDDRGRRPTASSAVPIY
jgi:outer membrane protein OmpA-like peptidoglycan-associated protein